MTFFIFRSFSMTISFSMLFHDCWNLARTYRDYLQYVLFSPSLFTFRDHLHVFVGQSLPSSSCTVSLYLSISSRLSIHLRLGRPVLLFPVWPSFFLRCCLLLFSWYAHTNLIVSVSGMLTFGTFWHPLVLSGFWHGLLWSYPLSIEAFSMDKISVLVFLSNLQYVLRF